MRRWQCLNFWTRSIHISECCYSKLLERRSSWSRLMVMAFKFSNISTTVPALWIAALPWSADGRSNFWTLIVGKLCRANQRPLRLDIGSTYTRASRLCSIPFRWVSGVETHTATTAVCDPPRRDHTYRDNEQQTEIFHKQKQPCLIKRSR